jgi:hypothetical protein
MDPILWTSGLFIIAAKPKICCAFSWIQFFGPYGDVGNILGTFLYFARQLDLRAIEKFKLNTLPQIPSRNE